MNTRPLILRLFTQTILLFFAFICLNLIYIYQLAEGHLAAPDITFERVQLLRKYLFQLTAINGLLSSGIYIISLENRNIRLSQTYSLIWRGFLWFSPLLIVINTDQIIQIVHSLSGILLIGWLIQLRHHKFTPVTGIWTIGMGVITVFKLVGWDDVVLQRIIAHIGLMLAGAAIGFWLMHRFSNITPLWRDNSLRVVATQLTVAGFFLAFGSVWRPIAWMSIGIVPLVYMIFTAHSYRALSDHNHTRTLAAHWYSLWIICLFAGVGIAGSVLSIPDVRDSVESTVLIDFLRDMSYFAVIGLSFGLINQAGAELRGENQRITGLMPFWMISFGVIFGGLMQVSIGLVQTYGVNLFSLASHTVEESLTPLYVCWFITQSIILIGIIQYYVGYNIRVSIKLVKNTER